MSAVLIESPSTISISQGAEAKVYRAFLCDSSEPILLKHRFNKQYRHPSLDVSLTRSRIAGEARALLKCLKAGVNVPGIRMVDVAGGVLALEWIQGQSVRRLLPGGEEEEEIWEDEPTNQEMDPLTEYGIPQDTLMRMIGAEIAKMHQADIIHGDLTTSNMMLRHPTSFTSAPETQPTELVLIDFGLAYHSALVEDKAVDLYVLERAFSSTHPDSEKLFEGVLQAYGKTLGKGWASVKRRLDDVRLRGRKRSMVG